MYFVMLLSNVFFWINLFFIKSVFILFACLTKSALLGHKCQTCRRCPKGKLKFVDLGRYAESYLR